MGRRIELPRQPAGKPEEQLQAMYSYLYQMAEALNSNLAEIGGSDLTDQERTLMREITGETGGPEYTEAETLKSLIIKTAAFVKSELDQYRMNLLGNYVAEGKFGKYVRNTQLEVDVNPEGIQQDFTFREIIQGLKTYEINAKNYIKTGLLRTVSGIPVYGVAIGKDIVTFAEDGTETYHDGNKVAELTADELSFWQGGSKVASYKGNRIGFYYGGTEVFYIQAGKIYCVTDMELTAGKSFAVILDNNEKVEINNSGIILHDEREPIDFQIAPFDKRINNKTGVFYKLNADDTVRNGELIFKIYCQKTDSSYFEADMVMESIINNDESGTVMRLRPSVSQTTDFDLGAPLYRYRRVYANEIFGTNKEGVETDLTSTAKMKINSDGLTVDDTGKAIDFQIAPAEKRKSGHAGVFNNVNQNGNVQNSEIVFRVLGQNANGDYISGDLVLEFNMWANGTGGTVRLRPPADGNSYSLGDASHPFNSVYATAIRSGMFITQNSQTYFRFRPDNTDLNQREVIIENDFFDADVIDIRGSGGKVLYIGMFSGSMKYTVLANISMNDATTPGFYYANLSTITDKPSDLSSGGAELEIEDPIGDGSFIIQKFNMIGAIYQRRIVNGTPSQWYKFTGVAV